MLSDVYHYQIANQKHTAPQYYLHHYTFNSLLDMKKKETGEIGYSEQVKYAEKSITPHAEMVSHRPGVMDKFLS